MARKLAFHVASAVMWAGIVAGVGAIFFDAWRRIDARYASEGLVTESLMMIIMGGIPSIAFAGVVHVAFGWLVLRHLRPAPVALTDGEAKPAPSGETFAD